MCAESQDGALTDLPCVRVECDEIWSDCYAKQKNVPVEHRGTFGHGDVWTWTAICADTTIVPSWLVGERTGEDAWVFMQDLSSRLSNRVQPSTDGNRTYLYAVEDAFGAGVDYWMVIKTYGEPAGDGNERRYSPPSAPPSRRRSAATPTRQRSPPATWSGRTSPCGWGCAASPG